MSEEGELKIRMPDGRIVSAKKMNFKPVREEWNEYELEDGSKLYVKLVLVDVVRLDDFSPIGEPIYQIVSQNLVKVKASKEALEDVLRRTESRRGGPEVR
ncbi:hypothetical protein Asulf_00380 [Archaeoglobus sulfaticallidus PM70-1]|uniref:Uncharacterized protein n=1 Tax=Archaeoglobus sulfaticallidus PM70-1 TaxID=387631 RepID=N0B9Z1_9EURY|nr:hypothetical protein [Archaeoglobus sulfaticallidus]AGK60409.1 hypothetical protein Asulf_00380 [Archaeoglobus sulfaticallidus PM70-1]